LEETTRREEIATVEAALAQLSPLWRAILYLRDGLGLSYREVAEVLDRSEDVVRVTLHRARLRIRAALTGLLIEGREI
ncbi:MAG: RNA polymerase sigma factor, partial [Planctomycetota bacterium]